MPNERKPRKEKPAQRPPKSKKPKARPCDPLRVPTKRVATVLSESACDVLDQIIVFQAMTQSRLVATLVEYALVEAGALAPSQAKLAPFFDDVKDVVRRHQIQTDSPAKT